MKRLFGLALLVIVLAMPADAWAQRRGRGRSGPAMTPYGPVANPTQSAEWRQAGGNPMIYEQIMERKMMAAQQKLMQKQYQQMVKQQQVYQKWFKEQKAKHDKGQPVDPAFQRMLDQETQYKAAVAARAARIAAKKTKKHTASKKKSASTSAASKKDAE